MGLDAVASMSPRHIQVNRALTRAINAQNEVKQNHPSNVNEQDVYKRAACRFEGINVFGYKTSPEVGKIFFQIRHVDFFSGKAEKERTNAIIKLIETVLNKVTTTQKEEKTFTVERLAYIATEGQNSGNIKSLKNELVAKKKLLVQKNLELTTKTQQLKKMSYLEQKEQFKPTSKVSFLKNFFKFMNNDNVKLKEFFIEVDKTLNDNEQRELLTLGKRLSKSKHPDEINSILKNFNQILNKNTHLKYLFSKYHEHSFRYYIPSLELLTGLNFRLNLVK